MIEHDRPPAGSGSLEAVAADLIAAHRRQREEPDWRLPRSELGRRIAALVDPRLERTGSAWRGVTTPRTPSAGPARTPFPSPVRAPEPESAPPRTYDALRRTFERNEAWLRRNASAMDRIVEGLRVDPDSRHAEPIGPLQRELRIELPREGVGRAYFLLRNGTNESRVGRLEHTRTRGVPPGLPGGPRVSISPGEVVLEPGETCEIGVRVDLAGCPIGPDHDVELGLFARSDTGVWAVVWVVLVVASEDRDGA